MSKKRLVLKGASLPRPSHTKRVVLTAELLVPRGATLDEVENFAFDLEWVGGCRDPDEDPLFESVTVVWSHARLKRERKAVVPATEPA
jgi:hypothetical protein